MLVLSALNSPGLTQAIYAGNALWFTSAFVHFGFRQPFMMRKLSRRRHASGTAVAASPAGDAWHHDIMAYLGGMNTSLALLALLRLYAVARPSPSRDMVGDASSSSSSSLSPDVTALAVLGLANFSQAALNFTIGARSDRWIMGKGLDRITVLDVVFTVLDWTAALARVVA
ncbi:hypothetical protein GGTG_03143 [Gaeumannomyces tritici R3-111a-1]|uniref:Integral membrane protein n=1 Tax=Gaeumannomyces tritici (strain R3-111a-1) TaxID=644352 RepID=J3NPD5_GAET3|nr:hypothetical protein GGTG_03143 [Gaeumannomyces tritici R3-111a-1]EJT78040.1 hypothetical protein GGTG_03143 [Gaeumannomyces tritici R3-111a-1]